MKPWGVGDSVGKGEDGIDQGISISNTEERVQRDFCRKGALPEEPTELLRVPNAL